APGPDGRPAGRARRAFVRHLQPPAQRADRLPRPADRRRDRQPRRRPAAAPRGRRPRPRHRAVRQLAGRPGVRRPGDLRHDAVDRLRRADDLLRRRDVDGGADPDRRRAGQTPDAAQRTHADPPAHRRLPGTVLRHRDPCPRDARAALTARRALRQAHGADRVADQRRLRARPLHHPAGGGGVRARGPDRGAAGGRGGL
ncbi:MAG: ATP-dependent Clp protease proteolytic subunit, partial [uncultured Solirubrobacteraceae bacterium]